MKTCARCGREIEPRRKWKKNWDQIKYCSDKCRNQRNSVNYEEPILELLRRRGYGKTICPSEILDAREKSNREKMEEVRQAARRLVVKKKIVITQNGQIVDPSTAKGPIRLRLIERESL